MPNVRCYGTASATPSLTVGQELIDKIPTTSDILSFAADHPAVQVVIPWTIKSTRGKPHFDTFSSLNAVEVEADAVVILEGFDEFDAIIDTIFHTGARGNWLELWTGAVAINAMCVGTFGRAGVAVMNEGLKITLAPRHVIASLSVD